MDWIKSKTRLERLKEKYCQLMKRAYRIAPRSKSKSDALNEKAKMVLIKIRMLDFNHLH
ncbi:Lacal_2735 family protein [Mesonia ostreae]|uniref:Lacal_2735 family protein n=1 Tax=Mesonia ostreae TaxID=861110 RepID=A0ABU2KEL5_9FLAO|nr:Lacal_2735 family protein [Mesonia ostreae]MDT0293143.1 Lacal_2735 family protein [Mesonia ostreae]